MTAMTNRTLHPASPAPAVAAAHDELCPRCGSAEVHAIVYGPLDLEVEAPADFDAFTLDDAPIFDCRDCGFEWGLAVRELLA